MIKALLVAAILVFGASSHAQMSPKAPELKFDSKLHSRERAIIKKLFPEETESVGTEQMDIYIAVVDLNRDSRPDIVAHVFSPLYCGTAGCAIVAAAARSDGGWQKVLTNVVAHSPIRIEESMENGFRPLWLMGKRGATRWVYDGSQYKP